MDRATLCGQATRRHNAEGAARCWREAIDDERHRLAALVLACARWDKPAEKFLGPWAADPARVAAAEAFAADEAELRAATVRELVRGGAPVNYHSRDDDPAVVAAAITNSLPALRVLLEMGADPNIVSRQGASALLSAAQRGFLGVVRELLRGGANVHLTLPPKGESAVFVASEGGYAEVVHELVGFSANLDARTTDLSAYAPLGARSRRRDARVAQGRRERQPSKRRAPHPSTPRPMPGKQRRCGSYWPLALTWPPSPRRILSRRLRSLRHAPTPRWLPCF